MVDLSEIEKFPLCSLFDKMAVVSVLFFEFQISHSTFDFILTGCTVGVKGGGKVRMSQTTLLIAIL